MKINRKDKKGMITITGKNNSAKVFTDNIESGAAGQIQKLLDQKFIKNSQIRIMPDVHAGAGCAIGTTMTITDKVVPNLVGIDIGCGMETVELSSTRVELPKLDNFIHKNIPVGSDVRRKIHKYITETNIDRLRCINDIDNRRAEMSLGTLGGGNHFIEIDKDDEGHLYLVVHSGSRNIGLRVAQYYQDAAFKILDPKEEVPYELAYCESELLADYLHDMVIMQEFAAVNRWAIVDDILRGCKLKEKSRFTTVHNYIDLDKGILRKGAVSAQKGEVLLIPINMRDGALICEGLGNADWNYSAPHGAGRLMSRSDAKSSFTLNAYKKEMHGIYSSTINTETIDECPMAYKSIEDILLDITPTAKVIHRIVPIYNFKAGEFKSRKLKR